MKKNERLRIGDAVRLKRDVDYGTLNGVVHLKQGEVFTITSWYTMTGQPKLSHRWIMSQWDLEKVIVLN